MLTVEPLADLRDTLRLELTWPDGPRLAYLLDRFYLGALRGARARGAMVRVAAMRLYDLAGRGPDGSQARRDSVCLVDWEPLEEALSVARTPMERAADAFGETLANLVRAA